MKKFEVIYETNTFKLPLIRIKNMLSLIVPIMFLSVIPVLYDPTTLPRSLIIAIIPAILILLRPAKVLKTNLASLMLGLLIFIYFLSYFINKQNYANFLHGSYGRNFGILTLFGLFFIFVISSSSNGTGFKYWVITLRITVLISIIYALVQLLNFDPINWQKFSGFTLTLGNPNFSGAFMAILSNIFLYHSIIRKKYKIINFLMYCLTLFLCYLNGSLQSLIIIVINLMLYYLFYFNPTNQVKFQSFLPRINTRLYKYLTIIPASLLILVVYLLDAFTYFSKLGNMESRLRYWRAGVEIFKDHWTFGIGIEGVQRFIGQYRQISDVNIEGIFIYSDRLHNVALDHLVSGGVFAGITYSIFISLVFYRIYILHRADLKLEERSKLFLLGSVWTGYFFQSMISPDHLILSALGYLSAGLLFTIPASSQMQTNKKYKININGKKLLNLNKTLIMKSTALICIVISVITYTKAINVDYAANQYLSGSDRENIFLNRILNEWPNSQILEEVGISEIKKPVDNCVLIKEISSRIISISYRNSNGWYLKTVCDEKSGNLNEALESISEAIKFDPLNPVYLVSRGVLEYNTGQIRNLKATIDQIKRINPNQSYLKELETLWLEKTMILDPNDSISR